MEELSNIQNTDDSVSKNFFKQLHSTLQKSYTNIKYSQNNILYTSSKNFSANEQICFSINLWIKDKSLNLQVQGKLPKSQNWSSAYEVVKKLNNNSLVQYKVYWKNQQKIFGGSSNLLLDHQFLCLGNQSVMFVYKKIQEMCKTVQKCYKIVYRFCKHNSDIKNHCKNINKLTYQLQQNRRQRKNKHTNRNFNLLSIKTSQQYQFIMLKQNKLQQLRSLFKKDQYSQQQKQEIKNMFLTLEQKFQEKQYQIETQMKRKQRKNIFSPMKIISQRLVQNKEIISLFQQIVEVEVSYKIPLSFNNQVNQEFRKLAKIQKKIENKQFEEGTNRFIKKFKNKINYTVNYLDQNKIFDNQKCGLFLLSKAYSNTISQYFCPQYVKLQEVSSIYSIKHPYSSVKKFVQAMPNDTLSTSIFLFKLKQILTFIEEVGRGINTLTINRLIHRDLKPGNILIGKQGVAKIIDFGSCCPHIQAAGIPKHTQKFDYSLRSTMGYFCLYEYVSRKIAQDFSVENYYRHRLFDIYSLGVITQRITPIQILNKNPLFQPIAGFISLFIKKCKQPNPDDRFQTKQVPIFINEIKILVQKIIKQYQQLEC